ncbi:SGNH/GDSL hydrolase family protein [Aphanothece sacrum]|uniref:Lipolytic protein G-D-S-L family n=1 Tax=Aphanothece sacrum FPU1 TaxID=1920663 RepID=A0A401IHS1_APHSA|nr:SGNH/GDSL hydrolase family protein [Aphanothece sacrum]GBF80855.1 lipolytic protein G-D-S-L family [Aphanothece sacrum FPU1]GBF85641.1 lipolytic protein G-D-S-L family [Aphanothece sacrum FPU3]
MPKLKKLGENILLGLGGVIFALAVGEITLRVMDISYPSFYQVDEYRGHALIPGISGLWTHEGNGFVSVNQDGLRDQEHTKEKPPNTFRIAILGDSFAEAIQVNAEQTFWSILKKELPNCQVINGRKVEVINFGVGDYGTAQELMTLRHKVKAYSPDLVILAIFTGNDIINNSKTLSPPDRFSPFLIKKDNKFVMDLSFKDTDTYKWRNSLPRKIIFSIVNNSRLLQVINEARIALKNNNITKQQNSQAENIVNSLDFTPELYKNPVDKNWAEAWETTEELVKMIGQETQQSGAIFLGFTLSNPAQVYPDKTIRDQYLTKAGIKDEFYPDKRLKQLGEKEELKIINLAPIIQGYADQNKSFLHGFDNTVLGSGHWNELGHEVAGQIMSDQVCEMLEE